MLKAIIVDWGRTLYDSERSQLFPDARNVLDRLSRQYLLAIVALATDGDIERRLSVLHDEELERLFSVVLFAKSDKNSLYEQALAQLRLHASEVAIVDDRIIRGIAWGNEHGAVTIWIRRGKYMDEEPDQATGTATHTISELSDLNAIL